MSQQASGPTDDFTRGPTNNDLDGYEWTCPYCGRSRLNRSSGDGGERNAVAALRTHVVFSDGNGHGPRNDFPDDGIETLTDHVRAVEGRR